MEKLVTLSLISHTNVGKTTLARTLLRRDVGQALDQAHVTDLSEAYELISTEDGNELRLWDTPGFGDTARLLKRLKQADKPLGWFVSTVWDRFADRPLWCSQQAIKNVRDEADIVLYLINASENPDESSYVDMEMEILAWTSKPVIVLLNQVGQPQNPNEENHEEKAWRKHFTDHQIVKEVATLDAYARCWVQEDALLRLLGKYILPEHEKTYQALSEAWHAKNLAVFEESMDALSGLDTSAATDAQVIPPSSRLQKLGFGRERLNREIEAVRKDMTEAISSRFEKTTDTLLSLHSLEGKAREEIQDLAHDAFGMPDRVNESLWAAFGGIAGGAGTGLAADVLSGGFSFFGGTILGGLAGGISSLLAAKGYNFIAGSDNKVRWSQGHFLEQFRRAVLAYLAVAHFGRGRGEWRKGAPPQLWLEATMAAIKENADVVVELWKEGGKQAAIDPEALHGRTRKTIRKVTVRVLEKLYLDTRIP